MTDDLVAKLRDEDSYYRLQEKHWCIDAEELERQRLAAADRIEALEAENERLRRDHAALAKQLDIAERKLKGVTKLWHKDRERLAELKVSLNEAQLFGKALRLQQDKARAALGEKQ